MSGRLKAMFLVGAFAVVAATATGVVAHPVGRIVGSARNDVLKGTPRSDILVGHGGNDRLFGLAGDDVLSGGPGRDLLVGGPGKDQLRCGRGKDIARVDRKDKVGSDCEVVKGLPSAEPPPPPAQTNPPSTAHVLPGRYCGLTNQGKSVCITVASNPARVTTYSLSAEVDCGTAMATFSFATSGPGRIQSDLTFSRSADEELADRTFVKRITVAWEISGRFDTGGNVAGTFFLKRASFDTNGTRLNCASTPTVWKAKLEM